MPDCNDCHEEFETWQELAQHIVLQRKSHQRKSTIWALKFLADKSNIRELPKRIGQSPDYVETEFGRENRENAVRHLSGESEIVPTVCPNCKTLNNQRIEAEFIMDRYAWRNPRGVLVVNCGSCKRKERVY